MARPKDEEPKQQLTVMVKNSMVAEIDKYAKKAGLSRSQMMLNFLDMGLDDAKILDKMGMLNAVKAGKKVINSLIEVYKTKKV